jgi:hypothetical protein
MPALRPQTMLELARANKIHYDFDDLKALLNLQCGIDQSGKDDTAAQNGGTPLMGSDATLPQTNAGDKARRQYNEYLIASLRPFRRSLSCTDPRFRSHRSSFRSIQRVACLTSSRFLHTNKIIPHYRARRIGRSEVTVQQAR